MSETTPKPRKPRKPRPLFDAIRAGRLPAKESAPYQIDPDVPGQANAGPHQGSHLTPRPTVLRPEYVVVGGDDDVVTFWHDYAKAEKFVRAYGGTIEPIPDVTSDTDPWFGYGEEE